MNYKNEGARYRNQCGYAFSKQTRGQSSCREERTTGCNYSQCREGYRKSRNQCRENNGHLHDDAPIAMVYSPVQLWKELYDPTTALRQGTIFKELDLPFHPTPCKRKENCQCQYR